jgi:hypothetical protein
MIAFIPAENRARAFGAAERIYLSEKSRRARAIPVGRNAKPGLVEK